MVPLGRYKKDKMDVSLAFSGAPQNGGNIFFPSWLAFETAKDCQTRLGDRPLASVKESHFRLVWFPTRLPQSGRHPKIWHSPANQPGAPFLGVTQKVVSLEHGALGSMLICRGVSNSTMRSTGQELAAHVDLKSHAEAFCYRLGAAGKAAERT